MVGISVVNGALPVTTAACSGRSGSASVATDAPALQVPTGQGSRDPQTNPGIWDRTMMRLFYDTLGKEGKILPQLAEPWNATPTKVTLKIKQGIKCDNGDATTADVATANFDGLKDPTAKVPFTGSSMRPVDYRVHADKAASPNRIRIDPISLRVK